RTIRPPRGGGEASPRRRGDGGGRGTAGEAAATGLSGSGRHEIHHRGLEVVHGPDEPHGSPALETRDDRTAPTDLPESQLHVRAGDRIDERVVLSRPVTRVHGGL